MQNEKKELQKEKKRLRVIGLTGGVGAGKSQILNILKKEYAAEIITADQAAHEVMEPGREGWRCVVRALGASILKPDGSIDRTRLSELIFQDDEIHKTVNRIIHPMVWKAIKDKISSSQSDLIVVESAIMGTEQKELFNEIWYIYASEENRLKRLEEGRGYSRKRSLSIMKHQQSDEEFRMLADRVIVNNGTVKEVRAALNVILKGEGIV